MVRLNLSHGSVDEHLERLERVRGTADRLGRPVAVLADLPGPKIRAGQFPEGGARLSAGEFVELRPGDGSSDEHTIWVEYETLVDDLAVDDRVILGDGAISMRVTSNDGQVVRAMIETGLAASPMIHKPISRLCVPDTTIGVRWRRSCVSRP